MPVFFFCVTCPPFIMSMGTLLNAAYIDVRVSLGENGPLTTRCECPSGSVKCSHAAALAIFRMFNVSCTDMECQWRKPAATNVLKSVKDLYPPPKPYCPLSGNPSAEDREWVRTQPDGHPSAMQWLLSPEPEVAPSAPPVPLVQHIRHLWWSGGRCHSPTHGDNTEAARQSFMASGRLTASNFGSVLSSKRTATTYLPCAGCNKHCRGTGHQLGGS